MSEERQSRVREAVDLISYQLRFSDELSIRRINQFGGLNDQVMRATVPLTRFFVSGTLRQTVGGVAGHQNDVVVGYQRSAPRLDSYTELATSGKDMVEDCHCDR